jgi:hypothetical protein
MVILLITTIFTFFSPNSYVVSLSPLLITTIFKLEGDALSLWVHRHLPWGCIYGKILDLIIVFMFWQGVNLHPLINM